MKHQSFEAFERHMEFLINTAIKTTAQGFSEVLMETFQKNFEDNPDFACQLLEKYLLEVGVKV